MKKYVLFGVGKYVSSFLHIIRFFGGEVAYLADNDIGKVGSLYEGKEIIAPIYLKEMNFNILISCVHYEEIKKQLGDFGILDRLISLYDCLQELMLENKVKIERNTVDGNRCYFDLYSGARWGGAENWNFDLAKVLYNKGYDVSIIADNEVEIDTSYSLPIIRIAGSNPLENIVNHVKDAEFITFINSFFGESFFSMLVLKILYPSQIKIVTVVHNDYRDIYQLCTMFGRFIDLYICVSSKIRNTLIKEYNTNENKVFFLHQPIKIPIYKKEFKLEKNIKIGIASRLTKNQKRCDLIPILIDLLEDTNINYEIHIAGDGDMLPELQNYIIDHKLESKIFTYGHLKCDQMVSFWKEQDIYVNLSDFEGTSLAMLEAMSYSCVPVVTDVSGVRDFIIDGVNGYIHECGNIQGISDSIVYLYNHRDIIQKYGQLARKQIEEKCDINDYADKFIVSIGGV